MKIAQNYNNTTHEDEVWYDSSNIVYSRMVEDEKENKGDLYIVFKNGTSYVYKGVSFSDYIIFKNGGTDLSQGKTLNQVIKPKYEFEKCDNVNLNELTEKMAEVQKGTINKANTYFISGHRDITEAQFEYYYESSIDNVLSNNPDAFFVIGDACGTDIMAQNYLVDRRGVNPDNITVYHMFEKPRNCNPKIKNLKGGFTSDDERDKAMTEASSYDIAFVGTIDKLTGTGKNILRRFLFI